MAVLLGGMQWRCEGGASGSVRTASTTPRIVVEIDGQGQCFFCELGKDVQD
jgi:hypothetical protein